MTQYKFTVNSTSITGVLGWNANGSLGSLNITDSFSTANTQSCSFAADDLARINQVNCGTIWGQNFSYDPFGNIQKNAIAGTGGSTFTPTYQSSPSITNRISSVGGVSAYYDANGNSLNDTFRTFTWDADSNPITIGSVSLTYDAFDRMVEQSVSGTNSEIVYSPAGVKLALMSGTTLTKAFVPLPGGDTAVYTSSGLAYYRHTDHLGSSRFASTPTQTLYSDTAYSPFGEPYASSGAIDNSFTGQNQDTTAGLYDFLYREHDPNQARWTSPDPAGLAAVDPTNPQSWNRYAYVMNSPMTLVDPLGLDPLPICFETENGPEVCIWPSGGGDGGGGGGCRPTYFLQPVEDQPLSGFDPYGFDPEPDLCSGGGGRGGGTGGGGAPQQQPGKPAPKDPKRCADAQAKVASLKQHLNALNPNRMLKDNVKALAVGGLFGCAIGALGTEAVTTGGGFIFGGVPGAAVGAVGGTPMAVGNCAVGAVGVAMTEEGVFVLSHLGELAEAESTGVQLLIAEAEASQACQP